MKSTIQGLTKLEGKKVSSNARCFETMRGHPK